ncbi:helix-turn-helix domain-containing protein [Bordetella pertussis]|uniref:helix-turn-helix domain-containing protein n=1 Tax=Bordetella pertussis TaxID=520 RepID=UPI002F412692
MAGQLPAAALGAAHAGAVPSARQPDPSPPPARRHRRARRPRGRRRRAAPSVVAPPAAATLRDAGLHRIDQALARHGGNIAGAAHELGIHRSTLYRHLARQRG